MKKENTKSLFVKFPENMITPSKNDILKGLSSKDIKEKEKNLKYLIVNILNDPYYDQLIMSVLNFVLPYQGQSVDLKKLLLIYWEIVQKRKPNGTMLDEFMMVCNNLRNDLTHANEYVVGMSLKLIGRIAHKEILDSLVPPIMDKCLKHVESFVRRNAVECLFNLFTQFGDELLPSLDEKMESVLKTETDSNTKRNALVLLFRVNSSKALNYLLEKLENDSLEEFNDINQLAIVKYLFWLCDENPINKSKYLKIIFEFLSSNFNAVLFEISNSISDYTNNWNAISTSVSQLLKIMQETPDVNVKLIILDKLSYFKSLSAKHLQTNLLELLKSLETENSEVKIKILKIIEDIIEYGNVSEFLSTIKIVLLKNIENTSEDQLADKVTKQVLKCLLRLLKKKINGKIEINEENLLDIFMLCLQHDYKKVDIINVLKSFIGMVVSAKHLFSRDISVVFKDNLLNIPNHELQKAVLNTLVEEFNSPSFAYNMLVYLQPHIESLKTAIDKYMSKKHSEADDEVKSSSTQYITKTVIKEDGTYGTEIVVANEAQKRDTFGNTRFNNLVNAILENSVFAVNFYRNAKKMLAVIKENSEENKLRNYYIYSAFMVYNYYQKKTKDDKFLFKELNSIIKELANKEYTPQTNTAKKMSISKSVIEEDKPKTGLVSGFDDLIMFRQLK